MRLLISVGFLYLFTVGGYSQEPSKLAKRYNIDATPERFPQKTPQETLQSVVKAIDQKRIDYLVAQLADPQYVDRTIAEYRAAIPKGPDEAKTILAFDRLVSETAKHFRDDPSVVQELRQFAKESKIEVMDNTAVGTAKSVEGRKVFLKKIEDRWFLENKQQ